MINVESNGRMNSFIAFSTYLLRLVLAQRASFIRVFLDLWENKVFDALIVETFGSVVRRFIVTFFDFQWNWTLVGFDWPKGPLAL